MLFFILIFPFKLYANTVTVGTNSALLQWTIPTIDTSGNPLTDLSGYFIFYGNNPSALTKSIQITNITTNYYLLNNLANGTWYFVVVSYTTLGTDSLPSNVVSKVLPASVVTITLGGETPNPPFNITVN